VREALAAMAREGLLLIDDQPGWCWAAAGVGAGSPAASMHL